MTKEIFHLPKEGPPQLIFDDGSRIMQEAVVVDENPSSTSSVRSNVPLHEYYEIDRVSQEVIQVCLMNEDEIATSNTDDSAATLPRQRLVRVALQFPDELLADSPEVCWLLEVQLQQEISEWKKQTQFHSATPSNNSNNGITSCILPFCFVLGDTTVHSCCPDEVAAFHLNADVLVHYGHACLSPTGSLPVVYSFGKLPLNVDETVHQLEQARKAEERPSINNKWLILYQVGYQHAMPALESKWQEIAQRQQQGRNEKLQVVIGQIPTVPSKSSSKRQLTQREPSFDQQRRSNVNATCCHSSKTESIDCDANPDDLCCRAELASLPMQQDVYNQDQVSPGLTSKGPLIVGGLELPNTIASWDDLSEYTILFVMPSDPTLTTEEPSQSSPHHRQYVNGMLCFLSMSTPPKEYWIYTPSDNSLRTNVPPSPVLHRQLKRRFFLTQKARDANVIGILVSNLSQQHLVQVVRSLQQIIQNSGKASYSFAIGKINPAKLANFAEIDVFCLVACREHSLLDNERDYPVPVITPMELEIALGTLQWGAQPYSLDCQDVMIRTLQYKNEEIKKSTEEDVDAPYFSLVTGGYMSKNCPTRATESKDLDLKNLPGQGQVMEYKSEAANFLRQREYQGLQSKVGQTEVKAAIPGLNGIASNYGGS
jgi:diphthamide biosynthesis protein 2